MAGLADSKPETFIGHEGFVLHGYVAGTNPAPRFLAIIVHGMAEHAGRYHTTSARLSLAGAVVYAYDHRGHGPAAAESDSLGFIAEADGFSLLVKDLFCVIEQVRASHPGIPCVLLGQSMGSLVIRDYMARYPEHAVRLQGAVLTGTVGSPGVEGVLGSLYAGLSRRLRGSRSPAPDLDQLTFGSYGKRFRPTRTRFDWLSRDPSEVDAYVADPLCGFVCSTGFFADLVDATMRVNRRRSARRTPDTLPVLVLSGGDDPVGGFGRGVSLAVRRYQKCGCINWTLKLYPDARHELYHETNTNLVHDDICEWLDRVLRAPGSLLFKAQTS